MRKRNYPSIAEIARDMVMQHPSIMDCIKRDIINYSALSSAMKEGIEQKLQKKIREEAIKVALIRFSQEITEKDKILEDRINWLLRNSTVELKSDIAVITVKQNIIIRKINEIMNIASRSRFFQLTQGTRTFTISFDKKIMGEMLKEIGEENVEKFIDEQSAIIIISPVEVIETPGFVSYITTQLTWNKINITQIISCHEDTILILYRKDAQKAYNIIEEMIMKHRLNSNNMKLK